MRYPESALLDASSPIDLSVSRIILIVAIAKGKSHGVGYTIKKGKAGKKGPGLVANSNNNAYI